MTLRYTTLRVTEAGVVLYAAHRERLGSDTQLAFDRFAATATPGVYAVSAEGGVLDVVRRAGSRLFDGIPTRHLPSPLAPGRGALAKPAPPCPYDAVRTQGCATLLTDESGAEILESCSAAVLTWDGRRAPRLVKDAAALILVNAVALTCLPQGSTFPSAVRAQLDEVLGNTTRRP